MATTNYFDKKKNELNENTKTPNLGASYIPGGLGNLNASVVGAVNGIVDTTKSAAQIGADIGKVDITNTSGSGGGNGGSGGGNGGAGVGTYGYSPYNESQAVIDARNAMNSHNANKVAAWTGGTYGQALQDAMDKITNREKFSYDLNGDALYQQYKDKYINQGRLAMQDTIGQASAMTGGYGNSYAATAGNQAYQGYLQNLNDVVPELYQLAYDKYNKEGEELYNQYGMINNQYQNEYGQYRDQVSDWNTQADRLANNYYNEANMDFSKYTSGRDFDFSVYQQQVAESQYAKDLALKQAQLNETIRANKASEELSRQKAVASSNNASNTNKTSAPSNSEVNKASSSSAVKSFNASIMTQSELKGRRYTTNIDGKSKRFDNYTQYVDAVLEKWYKSGKLTENEVGYLKGQYGI